MAEPAFEPDNEATRAFRRFNELRAKHGGAVSAPMLQGPPPVDMSGGAGEDRVTPISEQAGQAVTAAAGPGEPAPPKTGIQGIDLHKRVVMVEGRTYPMNEDEARNVATFCLEVMGRELAKHIKALGEDYGIAPPAATPVPEVPSTKRRK